MSARTIGALAVALGFVGALASCGATSNPARDSLRPAERVARENAAAAPTSTNAAGSSTPGSNSGSNSGAAAAGAAATGAAATGAAAAGAANSRASNTEGAPASSPDPKPQAGSGSGASAATAPFVGAQEPKHAALGRVGGELLLVEEFLRRLWMHDNSTTRDVLEQMIFARLVLFEADRFGVELPGSMVDEAVRKGVAAVEKRLREKNSTLSFDEHVKRNLEVDPKLYRASLRADAIVSLLAERCVRAWVMETGACKVRMTEIREREKLDAARADLSAGKPFEEVARTYGLGEDKDTGLTKVRIVRAESQELSRVAFATEVGAIGGPIEQSGAWLLFIVDERDDGREIRWASEVAAIEASLARDPVQNVEFVQWRSAMSRRYQLDLGPLLEMVSGQRP